MRLALLLALLASGAAQAANPKKPDIGTYTCSGQAANDKELCDIEKTQALELSEQLCHGKGAPHGAAVIMGKLQAKFYLVEAVNSDGYPNGRPYVMASTKVSFSSTGHIGMYCAYGRGQTTVNIRGFDRKVDVYEFASWVGQ